jgi:CheY-like chemotaxis protein
VTFSIEIAPGVPAEIVSDRQRMRQVLTNLLSNAFKFTERGGVQLRVDLARTGWSSEVESLHAASSVLAFTVRDTGIGIEREEQRRVFEAFAQGDGSTARRFGGTGLGLSISRELVTLLKGEIGVVSTPGEGSAFTVYLPLRDSLPESSVAAAGVLRCVPAQAAPRARLALVDMEFKDATILVVDDDFRNIFAMTALLERGQARVIAAESGVEALAALRDEPGVDLVLMDIMMPEMDGYETIRAIRADAGFGAVPIIAVTGKVVAGERERCLSAGANDYVTKPVDTEVLLAAVGLWLSPPAQAAA